LFSRYLDDIDNYSSAEGTYLDVPFVPSEDDVVEAMLELANVGPKDVLYDLGSGDGRIVVAAARKSSARAIGIEVDPVRIAEAFEYAEMSQVEDLVDFVEEDIFTANFSEASAVTLYLLQSINEQLKPRLLSELRPGTRVVSHAFDMGDWRPDETRKVGSVNIYKWVVPANVDGIWEWERGGKSYRVDLEQSYQDVGGAAWINGEKAQLRRTELRGRRLKLAIREVGQARSDCFALDFANGRIRKITPIVRSSPKTT